ncbi:MAG: serine acetyltransferase [Candidatus Accumulibacter sp.]|jgi:serine O-acetyltransferase|nr:serine acetyltransferase [Accumulibacter sp.]
MSTLPLRNSEIANSRWNLAQLVSELRVSRETTHRVRHKGRIRELPSRVVLEQIVTDLAAALFPTHYGNRDLTDESVDYFVGNTLNTALTDLTEQVRRGLFFASDEEIENDADLRRKAIGITRAFAARLPAIRALLVSDLHATYQGDPAAGSYSEILLCYPGVAATIYHRVAHTLRELGVSFLARLISDIAHSKTGIDIHPGARIGGHFCVDHGTGVVIGETAIIGERVRLYQAVTLGARRFPADENGQLIKGGERHPIVEDDVVIYAGATVLGRITIGRGSSIGGNVWLTHSVPPGSNITQAGFTQAALDRGQRVEKTEDRLAWALRAGE